MYITVPLYVLVTVENSEKPFPYKMVFPYDANHGFAYFLSYLMSAWAGFACVVTLFAEDSLICYFIIFACGRFQIIHHEIENLISTGRKNVVTRCQGKVLSDNELRVITWESYQKLLRNVIKHQNTVIKYVKT